jgi:hypothetical protein
MYLWRCIALTLLAMGGVGATSQITFCMVTSERPVSYLERVVDTFIKERVGEFDGVGLIVVNMDGSNWGDRVVHPSARKMAVCDTPDVEGIPICKVRQGTLDVTESLLYCANQTSGWVVLAEDDCEACPGSIQEAVETLARLDSSKVSLVKFSKIATGVAFPRDKVELYARHAQAHVYDRPHDYYSEREWDPNGGGVHVHGKNLFHHIGEVSTIPYRNHDEYHKMYDDLRSDYCGEAM